MKIITRKKQVEIAKRLAAIYYTACHWQDEEWEDFVKCIVGNCADIAFTVGGEHMMTIEVPDRSCGLIRRLEDLPSAQPEPKWIPCSERLPEYGQEVLVTRHFLSDNQLKKNAITESFYVEVASLIDDEWTSYSDEYKIKRHLHKVIAWMPLPEPWKGEEDADNSQI